jgi:hypothetical protein
MKILNLNLHLLHYRPVGLRFLISWGVIGHERINRAAVMALPKYRLSFTIILILLLRVYSS